MAQKKEPKKDNLPVKPRVEHELLEGKDNPIDSWRIFKIMSEFVQGFEMIRQYGKAVTFFGSARCTLDDDIYKDACELARKLSDVEYTIITGGGDGIMEAANRGAFQAGGRSVGLNIDLPHSQGLNPCVHESMNFHYFFTRKVMLAFSSEAYIYFPGGFGTLDEFFELTTLVQTEKIKPIPIILYGREYWEPLTNWFEESLVRKHATINQKDTEIYKIVDSVPEAYDLITSLVDSYCKKIGGC